MSIPIRTLLSNRDEGQTQLSNGQFAQNGNMVGWLLPTPDLALDGTADEAVRSLRRQQNMIDADAMVLNPCTGLIIPEGIAMRLGVAGPESVGQAQIA